MSDPTPVPVHRTLEDILLVLQQSRDNANDFYASIQDIMVTENQDNSNRWSALMLLLNDMNGRVDGINAALEILNNNASLNAQNTQQILLDSVGACCDDIAFGTGEVDDLCQKAQDAIAYVVARLLSVGATYAGVRMPTNAELITLFTYVGTDGRSYQLLTQSEAGKLLAAFAVCGVGNLGYLNTLLTDEPIKAAVLELLGTSNSAEQSSIRISALPGTGYDTPACAANAFFAAFSPTLINSLWKDPAIWDPAPYEDICSGPPPIEGTGWAERSSITTETGVDNWSGTRNVWDLSSPTPGNISPLPYFSAGQTLYIQHCGNATNGEAERDETIWLGKSNTSPDSIFLELPYRAERTWVCDGSRYLYIWAKGQEDGAGNGVAYITASWIPADAATHCPE